MLLGSPPDMVHRAPAHGAHIRMQNSAIYSPVRFKYYTIPLGTTGQNGADCNFTARQQEMTGDMIWDSISQLDLYVLDGNTLTGAVLDDESNGGDGYATLYLDSTSKWVVTGDSTVTNLYNAGTIVDASGNIVSVVGTDGTVYVQGTSQYTVTVTSYSTSVDTSAAATADSWSDYEVEKA